MFATRMTLLALSFAFAFFVAICFLRTSPAESAGADDPQKTKATKPVKQDKKGETLKSDEEPSVWMRQKLNHTQNILEGMARGDYKTIAKSAQSMKFLNRIEGFVRQRPEGYRAQLKTFQDALTRIETMAQNENLDGVTLGFYQLTMSCVQCHRELREGEAAEAPAKKTSP